MLSIVVLISGSGSKLQAINDTKTAGPLKAPHVGGLSHKAEA